MAGLASPPANFITASAISGVLDRVRRHAPKVHAITSPVALPLTANGLLALGATPSLTVNPTEIRDFVASADALLCNLGMLDAERRAALPLAAHAAQDAGIPFVLDPVFAERSPARRDLALSLMGLAPAILKLNREEFLALPPLCPPETAILRTGETDRLTLGAQELALTNGHPLLGRVTATGCLLGAIAAACIAIEPDRFLAAASAVTILNIAAEGAGEAANGPGSFAVLLLDHLSALTPATLEARYQGSLAL